MTKLTDSQMNELRDLLGHDPYEDGEWSLIFPTGPCVYAINSKGTIVARLSCIDRANRRQRPRLSCIRQFPDGYLCCSLNNKDRKLHRIMAATWLDDWDESLTVNHKDGNKHNNDISNLEMMTVHDNCIYYHTADCIKEQRIADYAHHGDTLRGRIHITNGVEAKMIHPEEKIPEGWWRGRPQSMKDNASRRRIGIAPHNKGKICINDGTTNRWIARDSDIPDGWSIGCIMNLSQEQRQKRSEFLSNSIFINKGGVNKRVLESEVESYLAEGWNRGRYRKR